jgi:hypothetical protein
LVKTISFKQLTLNSVDISKKYVRISYLAVKILKDVTQLALVPSTAGSRTIVVQFFCCLYNVTDFIKTLPGNESVNTSKYQQYRGNCFICGLRQARIEQRGYAVSF